MKSFIFFSISLFSPLIGFMLALFLRRKSHVAKLITCSFMLLSLAAYIIAVWKFPFGTQETYILFTWIKVETLRLYWGIYIDSLSIVMMGIVLSVSILVHIYSIGYMAYDPGLGRFMSYLSLFTFAMLLLIVAPNLGQLFVGWEGVGFASYLLIGFWYERPKASMAAIKAFVVNRTSDAAFILGICAAFFVFNSLDFKIIFLELDKIRHTYMDFWGFSVPVLNLIAILLFIGAMGKSAQFGFHTWLPDAMEGPTPVSALIHAATMVTAGVFLVARLSPLYELSPFAKEVMIFVGIITASFAACVAITQNDIKRIIAYSTCSQLGYMMVACGCGAYNAAIFHLMTHAFFKALLFLGAGSVIHAMSDEQDIQKMGGIYKLIPFTYSMIWIGSLALAGIPFYAGYFSKEAILESIYSSGHEIVFFIALGVALLTAFYSWRLIILAFHGKARANEHVMAHVQESPPIMLVPLAFLSFGALFSGWIGSKWLLHENLGFKWGSSIAVSFEHMSLSGWLFALPVVCAIGGILIAYLLYVHWSFIPKYMEKTFIYKFFFRKWLIDELYQVLFVKPVLILGSFLWRIGDKKIIDGIGPDGTTHFTLEIAKKNKWIQTGYLSHYALIMLVGIIFLISAYVWWAYFDVLTTWLKAAIT